MPDHLHIVCPHCLAVNRVPETRLGEEPKCGKCTGARFTIRSIPTLALFRNGHEVARHSGAMPSALV